MRNIHGDCVPLLLAILMSGVQASPDPGDEGDGAAAGGGVGPPDPEPGFSRGESIALWVGVILLVARHLPELPVLEPVCCRL